VEQIKENPYLQFFIGLEAFEYSAPFDPSMMVYFRKRLPVLDVNYVGGSRQLRRRVTPGPPPAMAGGGDSEK
jgi:hypothetical protein